MIDDSAAGCRAAGCCQRGASAHRAVVAGDSRHGVGSTGTALRTSGRQRPPAHLGHGHLHGAFLGKWQAACCPPGDDGQFGRAPRRRCSGRSGHRGGTDIRWRVGVAGRLAGHRRTAAGRSVPGLRDGREQRPRVGVRGRGEDLVTGADLDDPTEVHDGDVVGDEPQRRQVVRDEQIRSAAESLQVLEQVEDLRADRHVQRRDRLVADDHPRVDAPAPGRWTPVAAVRRRAGADTGRRRNLGKPDPFEELLDRRLLVGAGDPRYAERLAHRVPDGHSRVERVVGSWNTICM